MRREVIATVEVLVVIVAVGGVIWWLTRGRVPQNPPVGQDDPPAPLHAPPARIRAAATTAQPSASARRSAGASQSGRWVPLGATVEVHGRVIDGGIYVGLSLRGSGMPTVSGWHGVEPALVDDRLRIDAARPDRLGTTMGYWPAYDKMTPAARAAYLDWLAAGRPAGAYIGYPFLFFAGLERRVLVDAQSDGAARAEVPALLGEVERLLRLYADNHSFRGYGTGFLAVARMMYLTESIDEIEPPQERNGWQLPVEIQLVVGTMVEQGRPIPAEWALAWVRTHPEIWLRTPAQRCPDEFGDLFSRRFRERHGEGLQVRRPQRRLTLSYRPASASFGGSIEVTATNLPDISELTAPTTKLAAIAHEVTESLSPYSRYVGRTEDRHSLAAIALLPPEMIAAHRSPELAALVATLEEQLGAASWAVVPAAVLTAQWPLSNGRMGRKEAVSLARLLAARGFGLEPDARLSSLNFAHHEHAVVWCLETADADANVTPMFTAACAVLRLGVMLAQADGEVSPSEVARLEQYVDHTLDLTAPERRRLHAHLQWLLAESLGQAGLKKQLGELDREQRQAIARLLIAVAAADGHLHVREMAALARAYKLLGLDPAGVHSDLHTLAAGDEPVSILDADPDVGDRAIPAPPAQADAAPQIKLDRARIERVLRSTEEVGAVLTAVFAVDAEVELVSGDEPRPGDAGEATIGGLDAAHSELVRRVSAQPIWPRAEFDALAEALGLMPGGAVEAVNDIAFEATGEPLLEGEEDLEVNGHALKELLDD